MECSTPFPDVAACVKPSLMYAVLGSFAPHGAYRKAAYDTVIRTFVAIKATILSGDGIIP